MVRDLLIRGLLAGLLAGVLALGVAELLGEPQVSRSIAVETRLNQRVHKPDDPAIVSRDVQSTAGLATGVLLVGTVLGGLCALAFAFAYGRIGRDEQLGTGPRGTAAAVATGGFVALCLVPFLKYPASPPSIGQSSTIDHRTELYFGLMLISVLLSIGAIALGRRLTSHFGAWNANLIAAALFILAVATAFIVIPDVNEVPSTFPAATLWRFRIGSLATQATLWAAIGLIFGALAERSVAPGHRRGSGAIPAPVR